ncbi:aminotriazole resistance [Apiospora arundinis]
MQELSNNVPATIMAEKGQADFAFCWALSPAQNRQLSVSWSRCGSISASKQDDAYFPRSHWVAKGIESDPPGARRWLTQAIGILWGDGGGRGKQIAQIKRDCGNRLPPDWLCHAWLVKVYEYLHMGCKHGNHTQGELRLKNLPVGVSGEYLQPRSRAGFLHQPILDRAEGRCTRQTCRAYPLGTQQEMFGKYPELKYLLKDPEYQQ